MHANDLLPIVQCGDPILRRPAEMLDPSQLRSEGLQQLIRQMRTTMAAAPGVGLAAPQVGVGTQIAVMEDGPERWGHLSEDERHLRERTALAFTVLINPVLQPIGTDTASFFEGCLSVPGLTGIVTRHRSVRVEALDARGERVDQVFSGWPARIVQHEIDHLNGCLYLDRVETRSLSTTENYARCWVGRSVQEVAAALGVTLGPSNSRSPG